ncbi:Serine proteinase inhibitor [Scale drop disease virus]|uniref:ORF_045R n=1 Tax=Scale drop disease virus TaxID=1697349 RepID=A0A0K1L751_9VIRU|nr:ORF_045R [Scale drop disease virus]AKU37460.1 ORF_045R [Scale drop disease virus]QLI60716.1 Serine proteinase inhibitor [Scale drop disease virus]QXJ13634.1 ORF045R [Scale drop disease virus]UNH60740.1 Serine proteinase inhibitor [Scale drop disease virus]
MAHAILKYFPSNKNSCISPLGIDYLLEMLLEGAAGNTRTQLLHALQNKIPQSVVQYISARMFVNTTYFEKWTSGIDCVEQIDFKLPESIDTVNKWVRESTKGKISSLFNEIPDRLKAIIANTIYFKDVWQTPFEDTESRPFYLSNGSVVDVDTMNCEDYFMMSDDNTIICLPYKNCKAAMYIILDSTSDPLNWMAPMTLKNVCLYLPKFKIEGDYNINEILKQMGVTDIFTHNCDFSMFTNGEPNQLYVTDVKQKTYICVDENGTEAAAATGCLVADGFSYSKHVQFNANRPFTYLIAEDNCVLFVGRCVDPRDI